MFSNLDPISILLATPSVYRVFEYRWYYLIGLCDVWISAAMCVCCVHCRINQPLSCWILTVMFNGELLLTTPKQTRALINVIRVEARAPASRDHLMSRVVFEWGWVDIVPDVWLTLQVGVLLFGVEWEVSVSCALWHNNNKNGSVIQIGRFAR